MLQEISGASWANIWAAVSAISTAITGIVASFALLRWRKQDELKAKMAFKTAIAEYAYVLVLLPNTLGDDKEALLESLNYPNLNENFENLKVKIRACHNAWVAMEGLLEKNEVVNESWNFIYDNHSEYLLGKIKNKELGQRAMDILEEKFIYR